MSCNFRTNKNHYKLLYILRILFVNIIYMIIADSVFSSVTAQVMSSDLPNTSDVKRKLAYFEEQFARCLVQKYALLPPSDQLASLALAIRKRFGQTQTITLLNYLEGESVPVDLLNPQDSSGKFILCIPEALFRGVEHVRRTKNKKMKLWCSLARDIVMCVGIETANELSRIYEYQIALMFDNASIRVLASHAAECAVDYVRNNTYLDRNSALHGVTINIPPNPDGLPKYLAVVIGDKEMKWELYDIFKKCGLRKEVSLHTDEVIIEPDEETLDRDPWTYHYATGTDPLIYGYRGQLIEWNFVEQCFELDDEENERFLEESIWRPDDFHRLYMPYRRLVGRKCMLSYISMPDKEDGTKQDLSERLKTEYDGNEEREEIQPVYRPLGKPEDDEEEVQFKNAKLDNMDLSRARLTEANLSGTTAKNSKLLLADVAKVPSANLQGADVSFSTLDSSLSPDRLSGVVARHVSIRATSPRRSAPLPINNGFTETNLDDNVFVEENASSIKTVRTPLVSNGQGQMVPITQSK